MHAARDRAWHHTASFFPLVVTLYDDALVLCRTLTRWHTTVRHAIFRSNVTNAYNRALERAIIFSTIDENDGISGMLISARLPVNDEQPVLLFYGLHACRP